MWKGANHTHSNYPIFFAKNLTFILKQPNSLTFSSWWVDFVLKFMVLGRTLGTPDGVGEKYCKSWKAEVWNIFFNNQNQQTPSNNKFRMGKIKLLFHLKPTSFVYGSHWLKINNNGPLQGMWIEQQSTDNWFWSEFF